MWNIATILSPHKILLLLFIILVLHEIVCHTCTGVVVMFSVIIPVPVYVLLKQAHKILF